MIIRHISSVDTRSISAEALFEPSVIIFSSCIGGDLNICDQIIADKWDHISRLGGHKGIIKSEYH
ncbi:hypothetical protein GEZ65_02100 [Escherichia albertii]|nr:hypothetical protein [Escherichia albertii]HAH3029308.1 hypothetical protein [Escherichia albertii]HAH3043879.1 hypothetical protein [Escherichia albertii]HAH3052891.1 hypothetical protein [Escherichia albertii]